MDITQTFYDNMASQYDKLFLDWNATTQEQAVILNLDWNATTQEQAVILNQIFNNNGFSTSAHILESGCREHYRAGQNRRSLCGQHPRL